MVGTLLSEKQFQRRITDYCTYLHLLWYHVPDSRRTNPGFPDLVVVGPNGAIFAEIKCETGRVSTKQTEWQMALIVAGQETYVWRPTDWPAVEQRLRELAA